MFNKFVYHEEFFIANRTNQWFIFVQNRHECPFNETVIVYVLKKKNKNNIDAVVGNTQHILPETVPLRAMLGCNGRFCCASAILYSQLLRYTYCTSLFLRYRFQYFGKLDLYEEKSINITYWITNLYLLFRPPFTFLLSRTGNSEINNTYLRKKFNEFGVRLFLSFNSHLFLVSHKCGKNLFNKLSKILNNILCILKLR